ncbi:MAG TPA: sugar nucleotide-binding protein, partial [Herpetosiphonaceae bacterium]|nr:sugar nucleotide-binding protein [Herpetosiphonaceae bacterium]
DKQNFVYAALRTLASGAPFAAASDAVITPTYVPDLVQTCLDLLIDQEHGIWHLATPTPLSWADLARAAAEMAGLDPSGVHERPLEAFDLPARRPCYSALGSERGVLLRPLDGAMEHYFDESISTGLLQRPTRLALAPAGKRRVKVRKAS